MIDIGAIGTWLIYNAAIPLCSIFLIWVVGALAALENKKQLFALLKNGQLFFYCITILAILLKDVATAETVYPNTVGFMIILIIMFSAMFGYISINHGNLNKRGVVNIGWASLSSVLLTIDIVLIIRITERLPL